MNFRRLTQKDRTIIETFIMLLDTDQGDGVNVDQYITLCDLLSYLDEDVYEYITTRVTKTGGYPTKHIIQVKQMDEILSCF